MNKFHQIVRSAQSIREFRTYHSLKNKMHILGFEVRQATGAK